MDKPIVKERNVHNMAEFALGAVQLRFANLVWEHEPISSGALVKLCENELQWKKPTTYTVLRKLCEKGLLQNVDGVVTSCVSRDAYYADKSREFLDDAYQGSLPAFVAAFLSRKRLSRDEIKEIQDMIDSYRAEVE